TPRDGITNHEILSPAYPYRIVLKDNIKNRIIEVVFKNNEPYCLFCDNKDCVHIGFVFSLPDVYKILSIKGIKSPK
ncbi:MAG: hypothetical protein KAF24_01075, partial [Nitrosopumilaceae archaeon]|nr:hypothetical protein [Nitrosopumilaceae archaeon]